MKNHKVYSGAQLVEHYDDRHFGGSGGKFVFRKDRMALEHVMPSSPGLILDVPCGTGVYSQVLNEMGGDVIAADASKLMLEKTMQRQGDIPRVLCDANHLPFGEGVFDQVVTIRMFQHFPAQEVTGFLRELNRVARSDGLVIFDTFRWSPRRMRILKHFIRGEVYVHSRPEVMQMIARAGLKNVLAVSLYLFSPIWYRKMPVWVLRGLDVLEKAIPARWRLRTLWACTRG